MQHYISVSPWSGRAVIERLQAAIAQRGDWAGGVLILDESGDEKYGDSAAGVAHQYNGRHKRVERAQVGAFLAYAQGTSWSWVDRAVSGGETVHARLQAASQRAADTPEQNNCQHRA